MNSSPVRFHSREAIGWLVILLVLAFFLMLLALPAFGQPSNVPAAPVPGAAEAAPLPSRLTPAGLETQFNAWSAVLLVIGGAAWHILQRIWPPLQRAYPLIVQYGGIWTILRKFVYCVPPGGASVPASRSESVTFVPSNPPNLPADHRDSPADEH